MMTSERLAPISLARKLCPARFLPLSWSAIWLLLRCLRVLGVFKWSRRPWRRTLPLSLLLRRRREPALHGWVASENRQNSLPEHSSPAWPLEDEAVALAHAESSSHAPLLVLPMEVERKHDRERPLHHMRVRVEPCVQAPV